MNYFCQNHKFIKCNFTFLLVTLLAISITTIVCANSPVLNSSTTLSSKSNYSVQFNRISDVGFVSMNIGYAVLETNSTDYSTNNFTYYLMKTVDGGNKWVKKQSSKQQIILDTENNHFGYKVANWFIEKTTDEGKHWKHINFNYGNLKIIQCLSKSLIFAETEDTSDGGIDNIQKVYLSKNGGNSWAQVSLPKTNYPLFAADWLSANVGYAFYGGEPGAGSQLKSLYYTNSGGKTWRLMSSSGWGPELKAVGDIPVIGYDNSLKFFSNDIGYINLGRAGIYRSTDFGVHFRSILPKDDLGLHYSLDMLNSSEGYVCITESPMNILLRTTNGGKTWTNITTADKLFKFVK